ncbi:hypothetical protein WM16_23335 [Burkholderia ubonensis]|uniref:Uncharacterized protein n=1 Tax=Burkholderia ubonensis TaxID=101571 RepID=A0A106D473_9BURK|nr:hypothetical protein [Burkholderia ubonensis]KVC87923.1 hypothetical protein WI76_31590 [Burkholderia ubonensis]KVX22321.1 hypothetical protein WL01_09810 [Burkholderia ubonensis]KWB36933.1 hypothetical protein WL33_15995 [Burkholderia ubonensis]KWC12475.1 hypothetical protein WL48_08310 [Burkholderia ubonensis]KWC22299.1 hypothetical protein WL50_16550 [Burkholderia ubonensis]
MLNKFTIGAAAPQSPFRLRQLDNLKLDVFVVSGMSRRLEPPLAPPVIKPVSAYILPPAFASETTSHSGHIPNSLTCPNLRQQILERVALLALLLARPRCEPQRQ